MNKGVIEKAATRLLRLRPSFFLPFDLQASRFVRNSYQRRVLKNRRPIIRPKKHTAPKIGRFSEPPFPHMGLVEGLPVPSGVTVSCQVCVALPALLVAWMVTVKGLPMAVEVTQETTPVAASIVIPEGPSSSDHVTGRVPCVRDGVGPV